MSRRRGEFEHRTSIFEGAFRAWSHLGGLEPDELETRSAADLDPLENPLIDDQRLKEDKRTWTDEKGTPHKLYFYEPLPRSGLSHPYVQAILTPWLGPEADHDSIQLGLTTLRTWWQHRRKGESPSAVAALNTEKMRGVVEQYTRHFFNLSFCLIVNDKEQGPRTLATKMKDLEKIRKKLKRKIAAEQQEAEAIASMASYTSPPPPLDSDLTPLEKLHAAQRRQLAESGGVTVLGTSDITAVPLVDIKNKCIPGNIDFSGVLDEINHHAAHLAHRGTGPNQVGSSGDRDYGDPNMTPIVFVSETGDIQIAMAVDGITCAHCVKIVETVLKGCSGNKSPIDGVLDAAADRILCQVLIKIEKSSDAKRIAFEASRNLSMVGYTARVKEMSVVNVGGDKKATMDLGALSTAFEVVATTDRQDVFDWNTPCSCPDNGILRDDCPRHSQMNTRIFDAFETRAQHVQEYMAGCGQKYGMPCTCGPDCRCTTCEEHCGLKKRQRDLQVEEEFLQAALDDPTVARSLMPHMPDMPVSEAPPVESACCSRNMSELSPAACCSSNTAELSPDVHFPVVRSRHSLLSSCSESSNQFPIPMPRHSISPVPMKPRNSLASRNPSILSFGGLRRMSLTSEAAFGRTLSGISALSIDWENMDDFDVNVDHSAHINNNYVHPSHGTAKVPTDGIAQHCNMMTGGECNCGINCLCAGCPIHDTTSSMQQSSPSSSYVKRSSMRKVAPRGA